MMRRFKLLLLAVSSTLLTSALAVAAYEAYAGMEYEEWKSDFDNWGWFEKVTVPSSNPVLMWEYRAYGRHEEIETNKHGFRGPDFEIAKPPGSRRYAFVGDSVTLGMRVQLQESFVSEFARLANERGPHQVEALNLGVDGYNILQVHELARAKAFAFAPDAVVYTLCLNDFDFEESSGKKTRYFKRPKSFFLEKMETLYRRWSGIDFHTFHYNKNKDEVFDELLRMRESVEGRGIRFYVAVAPTFHQKAKSFEDQPTAPLHGEIVAFLELHGIEHIDLFSVFERTERAPASFSEDVWHPNAEGHALIARELVKWLVPS